MEADQAKKLVLQAGKGLVEAGLIARTWGNVSCRVDENTFAVTPSGRAYEALKQEEIVLCRISDASYEGEIKPSSEKGIHALIYRTYPDINFVIHTHQPMASAVSAAGLFHIPDSSYVLPGDHIPVAEYGLPGTKKLRENIRKALEGNRSKAVIMAHHGALCFGKDSEEAFSVAMQLEQICDDYIRSTYLKMSHDTVYEEQKYLQHYISAVTGGRDAVQGEPRAFYRSRRIPGGFVLTGETGTAYRFEDQMPLEAQIHMDIYQKRQDINYISQDMERSLAAISLARVPLKPLLDDFAQIVGSRADCAKKITSESIVKALGRHMGVIVPGSGAICCAASESDLHAVKMVMEKNAAAQIAAQVVGRLETINLFDCKLMHFIYTKSYARKAASSGKQQ